MPESAPSVFYAQAARLGAAPAFRVHGSAAPPVTWSGWADAATACARALVADGFEPGAVAAIVAGNVPLWPVADLGVLTAGLRSAGVFPASAPAQLAAILRDANAAVVFVAGEDRLRAVHAAAAEGALPALRRIIVADESDADLGSASSSANDASPAAPAIPAAPATPAIPAAPATPAAPARDAAPDASTHVPITRWADWLAHGTSAYAPEVARRLAALSPEDVAVVIYTSGSTGEPKGALLSHRYLLSSAASISAAFALPDGGRMLSFLPYSHAAERVFGLYTRILRGTEAVLVPDPRAVWAAAVAHRPTVFGGLPRYYEKLHEALVATRTALDDAAAVAWDHAFELGRRRSALRREGAAVPAELDAAWQAARGPLAAVLADRLGPDVEVATSGGAALPRHVVEALDAVGLTVLGAYGLTEHLCVASHRQERYGFDTVGLPMPGTELRIGEGGEVLVRRNRLTFSGYLGRPAETAAAFTPDGEWLRTGDLGALGADGALRVTGRSKDLIALSTGRKVAPAPIEARLAEHPLIASAVLFGEGRKFVTALVSLRPDAVARWAASHAGSAPEHATLPVHGGPSLDRAALHDGMAALDGAASLQMAVAAAIAAVNATLSPQERVQRFALLDRELTEEAGELTPTLKVRREIVTALYRDRLEQLYAEGT